MADVRPGPKERCVNRPIPMSPPTRRAFTLLEILVVIVIIGILSTLLIIGIKVLATSAKRQQTQGQFQQLRSLYAEYNAQALLRFSPVVMPCPQNVAIELNSGPGPANDASVGNRYGAAVWYTRDLMSNLRKLASGTSALNKMADTAKMSFPASYNAVFPTPYVPASWSTTATYQPLTSASYGRVYVNDASGNQVYYECVQALPAASSLSPSVDRAHWLPAYPPTPATGTAENAVPVLLDGWGNPIIFVPGGTLGNPTTATTGQMFTGSGTAATATNGVASPDGRPFFASAGPDGDFSKGDDNLYAFE